MLRAGKVKTVIVAGKVLVRDGKVLNRRMECVLHRYQQYTTQYHRGQTVFAAPCSRLPG